MARVPPVPVLGKMPLGTGLALGRRGGRAVSLHGRAGRTLVAQQDVGRDGLAVLVLGRHGRLLEGPGERSREELREEECGFTTESTTVTKALMRVVSGAAPLWLHALEHSPSQSFQ